MKVRSDAMPIAALRKVVPVLVGRAAQPGGALNAIRSAAMERVDR